MSAALWLKSGSWPCALNLHFHFTILQSKYGILIYTTVVSSLCNAVYLSAYHIHNIVVVKRMQYREHDRSMYTSWQIYAISLNSWIQLNLHSLKSMSVSMFNVKTIHGKPTNIYIHKYRIRLEINISNMIL